MPDAEPTYKWPAKVIRYKITCPFQRFLVAKYESIIDWNGDKITSAEALEQHIREKMLAALLQRLDPASDKSCYCRTINLAHMLANPAEHIQQARAIREQQGEDAARTFLLDHINQHKRESFEAWQNYLTKDNQVYARQPAFQYLMLRPVLESSDTKNTRPPIHPDAEALAHLYESIEQGRILPSAKLLQVLCTFVAFGGERKGDKKSDFGTACGWVVVTKSMDKAAERVAALSQGSGWCVASSRMAASYLNSSNFHLLVENGRAVSAIRISGVSAVEIQGKGNQDPGLWWPRILLYLSARALQISDRMEGAVAATAQARKEISRLADDLKALAKHLKEHPAQVQFVPAEIANEENYRPLVEAAWLACVKADPMCAALAPAWMPRDGKLDQMFVDGWRNLLEMDFYSVMSLPETLQVRSELAGERWLAWGLLLHRDPTTYETCPADLRSDPDIMAARKLGWIRHFQGINNALVDCPPDLHEDPDVLMLRRSAWAQFADYHASAFEPICPPDLKGRPEIQAARKSGWRRQILANCGKWAVCPADLKPNLEDCYLEGLRKIIRNKPRNYEQRARRSSIPEVLQNAFKATDRTELIIEQVVSILLGNQTGIFSEMDVPEGIRQHPDYQEIREAAWREVVSARPPFFAAVPGDLRDKPGMSLGEVVDSRANLALWQERVRQKPWLIEQASTVPKSIRNSHALFEAYIAGWAPRLRSAPWRLWASLLVRPYISYAVLYHPKIIDAMRDGWIDQNDRNHLVRAWNHASNRMKGLLALQLAVLRALQMIHVARSYWPREVFEELAGIYKADTCVETASDHERIIRGEISLIIGRLEGASPLSAKPARRTNANARNARPPQMFPVKVGQPNARGKEEWQSIISRDPREWDQCPAVFQNDAEVLMALKTGWLRLVELDPSVSGIPGHLGVDPDIRQKIINTWRRNQDLLAKDCLAWPDFVCDDPVANRRAIAVIKRALGFNPALWTSLPPFWRRSPDLQREAAESWVQSPLHETKPPPEDIRELVELISKG